VKPTTLQILTKQVVTEYWLNVISMVKITQIQRLYLPTNLKLQLHVRKESKRPVTGLQERLVSLSILTVSVIDGVSFRLVG